MSVHVLLCLGPRIRSLQRMFPLTHLLPRSAWWLTPHTPPLVTDTWGMRKLTGHPEASVGWISMLSSPGWTNLGWTEPPLTHTHTCKTHTYTHTRSGPHFGDSSFLLKCLPYHHCMCFGSSWNDSWDCVVSQSVLMFSIKNKPCPILTLMANTVSSIWALGLSVSQSQHYAPALAKHYSSQWKVKLSAPSVAIKVLYKGIAPVWMFMLLLFYIHPLGFKVIWSWMCFSSIASSVIVLMSLVSPLHSHPHSCERGIYILPHK